MTERKNAGLDVGVGTRGPLAISARSKRIAPGPDYERPAIQTCAASELIESFGPAQGYCGGLPGTLSGGGL